MRQPFAPYRVELAIGIEPMSPDYKSGALPIMQYQQKAERVGFEPTTLALTERRSTIEPPFRGDALFGAIFFWSDDWIRTNDLLFVREPR